MGIGVFGSEMSTSQIRSDVSTIIPLSATATVKAGPYETFTDQATTQATTQDRVQDRAQDPKTTVFYYKAGRAV